MRKFITLLGLFLTISVPCKAQNGFYGNVAFRQINGTPSYPASGAVVTVCSLGASGTPCSPTTSICTNPTDLVCTSPNPFNADTFGNFGFWAKTGNYTITITGSNVNSYSQSVTISLQLASSGTFSGTITFSGPITFTNTMALNGAVTATSGITTNSLTDSGLTSGNCVQASTGGLLTTTGSACGSSGGTVTVTGSPVSGNLTKFSGATSITNADLAGDVTTLGTTTATVAKVNGVTYSASPSTNTVPIITATNTSTYTTLPNCLDSLGQHLNYNSSSFAFLCGTTSGKINASFTYKSLGGNVSFSSNSLQSIDSISISSWPGCGTNGCRVRVYYSYMIANGSNTGQCYVSDGTNTYAESGETTSGSQAFCSSTAISPTQFSSNSGTFTFTVSIFNSGNGTVQSTSTFGTGVPSYMEVEVIPSN